MIQLPPHLADVVDSQYHLVMALDNSDVIKHAKEHAYYMSMLSAAEADPLDDLEEQTTLTAIYESAAMAALESYMEAVNKAL